VSAQLTASSTTARTALHVELTAAPRPTLWNHWNRWGIQHPAFPREQGAGAAAPRSGKQPITSHGRAGKR